MRKIVFALSILLLSAFLFGYYFLYRVPKQKKESASYVKRAITKTKEKVAVVPEATSSPAEIVLEGEVKSQVTLPDKEDETKKLPKEENKEEEEVENIESANVSKEAAVATARSCSENESVPMYGYLASRIGESCVDNPIDPFEVEYLEVDYFEGLYDSAEDSSVYQSDPEPEVLQRSEPRPYWSVLFGFNDTYDPETGFKLYNPSVRVEIDALDGRVARVYYGSPIVFDIDGERLPVDFGL